MPHRVFATLTPAAGRGRAARAWRTVRPALRDAGLSFDEVVEQRPQLAIGLAEAAARRGCHVIAAGGADGPIHEVVSGIMAAGGDRPPALAIIPGGTGND